MIENKKVVLHRFIISALRNGALLCLQTIEAEEWMEALYYPYISFRNYRSCRLGPLYLQETLPNMLNQIRRLSAIVNKLSGIKEYVEVTLRLKITNDFVMALLSRSSSIEIPAPQSLKDRMYDIWTAAPGRNK